jgi:hypothetical protein
VVAVFDHPGLAVPVEALLALVAQQVLLRLRRGLSDVAERHEVRVRVLQPVIAQEAENARGQEMAVPQCLRRLAKQSQQLPMLRSARVREFLLVCQRLPAVYELWD